VRWDVGRVDRGELAGELRGGVGRTAANQSAAGSCGRAQARTNPVAVTRAAWLEAYVGSGPGSSGSGPADEAGGAGEDCIGPDAVATDAVATDAVGWAESGTGPSPQPAVTISVNATTAVRWMREAAEDL
jgi:hypothetical protein